MQVPGSLHELSSEYPVKRLTHLTIAAADQAD